jgi:hypothetical protein
MKNKHSWIEFNYLKASDKKYEEYEQWKIAVCRKRNYNWKNTMKKVLLLSASLNFKNTLSSQNILYFIYLLSKLLQRSIIWSYQPQPKKELKFVKNNNKISK